MQSGKKSLSTFIFILLISTLPSAANAAEITWPEVPLITDSATDRSPCVKQIIQGTNKTIWVVWSSNRNGNYDIYYTISSDGGATWSDEKPITNHTGDDKFPSITQTVNGTIWVVWARYINYQWDLYYTTSNDGGATWSNEKPLTEDPNDDRHPSITQTANETIWVVWQSDRIWVNETIPQDDLFYKTSSDGGATWSNYTRLTNDTRNDATPSITQADDKIWVTWSSDRYDGFDVFYKTSPNGITWSDEFRLTNHTGNDWSPSIIQTTNGKMWIVWHSKREENYDIYYRTSNDGGDNWSNDTRLTTDAGADITPSITQTADSTIWIVWATNRAGNYDIWYTNSLLTAVPDIAITAVTPNSTMVFRGETVSIEIAVANEGNRSETFNTTVYADEIIIGNQTITNLASYNNTTLTFNWNTKPVLPGNYIISAYAWPVQNETDLTDNLLTNGVIQIRRLLGDLNYDGYVDQDDWMLFLAAYPSSTKDPNYNPDADLHPQPDGDGDVDEDDYNFFLEYCLYQTTPSPATEWPAIYITPSPIINTELTPTKNFTITIETDYNGSDIWGWTLTLTYNPLVLEGFEVVNGNLTVSTTHPATFKAGTFDNNAGKLSLTGGYFNVTPGQPVNVTFGPGILANVTFRVVGYGDTPVTIGTETKLIGYNASRSPPFYDIVDARIMPYNIGHCYFRNTVYDVVHDVAVLSGNASTTPPLVINETLSPYVGRNVSISVTVKNEGNVNETLAVSIYWRFISPDWLVYNETVTLDSNQPKLISVVWNTTHPVPWLPGTGNLTVVVSGVWNEKDTADNQLVIDAVHVRILGDTDADGDVDSTDCMLLIGVYPDTTSPPADPNADLDNNGIIDDRDWMILVGNLGESEY